MSKEGILLEVSNEWLHTMGYTKVEVIGRPFKDFLCDKDSKTCRSNFILAKSDGKTLPIIRKVTEVEMDGKKYYMENFTLDER
ncbi:MAG: PAS domain S-box protein [Methanolobus sp.]|nr:PAS domain S-box protein [Methanolobus sp.]